MTRKMPDPAHDYGTVKLTHHAAAADRAQLLGRSKRKRERPECLAIGHAWTEDPARHGGSICLVCHVVRWP